MDKSESGSCDFVESVVKITVSPNTPSPEPREDDTNPPAVPSPMQGPSGNSSQYSRKECIGHMEQQDDSDCYSPDVPTCIDFGIQDYLCQVQHETELDMSSDTDTSYLGATPPHRFSDGEIDPIEAMPVLLDTQLNIRDGSLTSLLARQEAKEFPIFQGCSWQDPGVQRFLVKSVSKESMLSLHIHAGQSKNNFTIKNLQFTERNFPRPFKRNISLPATIFKTYLIEHTKSEVIPNNKLFHDTTSNIDETGDIVGKNGPARLSKIDSISNSSQTDLLHCNENNCNLYPSTDTISRESFSSNWNISADSEPEDVENQPFTSDVEKRSLMIRHMRRLIRQDTTGNFAPPDYHI